MNISKSNPNIEWMEPPVGNREIITGISIAPTVKSLIPVSAGTWFVHDFHDMNVFISSVGNNGFSYETTNSGYGFISWAAWRDWAYRDEKGQLRYRKKQN